VLKDGGESEDGGGFMLQPEDESVLLLPALRKSVPLQMRCQRREVLVLSTIPSLSATPLTVVHNTL